MENNSQWVWASRPSKTKQGSYEVYKKYANEPIVENKVDIEAENKRIAIEEAELKQQLTENKIRLQIREKREKRERLKSAGIYVIICEAEKSAYVGQSINIESRLRSHKFTIQSKGKTAKNYLKLKQDYRKHGIEKFEFKEYIAMPGATLSELLAKENEVMIEFARNGYLLYNSAVNATVIGESIHCPTEYRHIITAIIEKLKDQQIDEGQIKTILSISPPQLSQASPDQIRQQYETAKTLSNM